MVSALIDNGFLLGFAIGAVVFGAIALFFGLSIGRYEVERKVLGSLDPYGEILGDVPRVDPSWGDR